MKNIIVCMKQVVDPEAPLSLFKIDPEAKQAILPRATPPVLNPFDENALEAALQIKDRTEANVTVISLGKKLARSVVKSPLAAGADQLVLVEDEMFSDFNTTLTAAALAAAIKKMGVFDLILCGLQAADTNSGQVPIGIASQLQVPCLTAARKVELLDNTIKIERNTPDGFEVLEVAAPAVITTGYEVGALREPGVEAFMSASRKPMTVWKTADLGVELSAQSKLQMNRMYQPEQQTQTEIIVGATPEEKAAKLIEKLKGSKII